MSQYFGKYIKSSLLLKKYNKKTYTQYITSLTHRLDKNFSYKPPLKFNDFWLKSTLHLEKNTHTFNIVFITQLLLYTRNKQLHATSYLTITLFRQ